MFNDSMNVRTGNLRRKQALARLAAKMMQSSQRASAFGQFGRVSGGLGRQRGAAFGSTPRRSLGSFARLMEGGGPGLGAAIGRFGVVDRQPGANDPALSPTGTPISGAPLNSPNDVQPLPTPWGGTTGSSATDLGLVGAEGKYGTPDNPTALSGATAGSMTGATPGTSMTDIMGPDYQAPVPAGFVMYHGQLIPVGVLRAMQQTGELF